MTAERWRRVKDLFETARQAPVDERERLLSDSRDLELAREVRVLLNAYDASSDFLEESALASHALAVASGVPSSLTGTRMGAYLIRQPLGEGGMGVVYEAVRADGQFEQTVAIKILKGWMMSPADTARFRSERQILAGLHHPNIARLLDGGTTAAGMPFYAMELVEGQYIDVFCRERNLNVPERLALFRQVCDAVEYAHRRGIVHRDLKPANILVEAGSIPKLLDFGIAKVQDTGLDTPRTATLYRVATPLYASPEQLKGGPITPASDVYSLGVLLYELLTGTHPFRKEGDALHQVANAICEQEPEPPGRRRKGEWTSDLDQVVLKAMRKAPAARYATAAELSQEVARYLDCIPVLARSGRIGRTMRSMVRQSWRPAIAALACVALFALSWNRFGSAPTRVPRRSLAVVGFQNLSGRGDAAWIGTALSEMLATDLASSERVRVVSADIVDRAKSDLNLADSVQNVSGNLTRMRTTLGVDYFVTGSYLAMSGGVDAPVRLNVRLQDAKSGQTLAGTSETGKARELSALVSDAIGDLMRRSEWSDVASRSSARVLISYANPESARLYAEGLERGRRFDATGARDLFRQAVDADPRNPLAHYAYGGALYTLGYEQQARAEEKLAYDLSATLSREERLSVAAQYYVITRNWSQAISTYRTLWDLFNDNPRYPMRLANAQIDAGKPTDALGTLQILRASASSRSVSADVDLIEARAARIQSDYPRELAAATRALQSATPAHARLQIAEAYQNQGDALLGLGKLDDSLAAYRSAEAIHRELGNTFGIASVFLREARPYRLKADFASFRDYTEKALALFEQIGNRTAMAPALNNLALATRSQGDMLGALKLYGQSIAISRDLGQKETLSGPLTNAGNILRRLNRQDEARRDFEEALSIAVELNNREQIARSHITLSAIDFDEGNLLSTSDHLQQSLAMVELLRDDNLKAVALQHWGDLKEAQGDLAGARQAYEQSIALARKVTQPQYVADGTITIAEIAREQNDFDTARRAWREALDYYVSKKQKNEMWDGQVVGARIRIAMGQAAGTEKEIEESIAGFHSLKSAARESSAYAVLADANLAQRKIKEARAAIARGREAFLATHEFQARMKYRLAAAKVLVAAADRAGAQELRTLLAELESKNWSQLASETRRALAEVRP